jgi:hypothetical protein
VKATDAAPSLKARPDPTFVAVGALIVSGAVVAVMLLDAEDALPVPAAFVPVTVNVYAVLD